MYIYHTVECCSKDCEARIPWSELVTFRGLCDKHFKELEEGSLPKEVSHAEPV